MEIYKKDEMDDFTTYLKDEMGLLVTDVEWSEAADLPLFLSAAAVYRLYSCNGIDFIAAKAGGEASLPDLKESSPRCRRGRAFLSCLSRK